MKRHRAALAEGCDGAAAKEDWTAFWDGPRLLAREYTKEPAGHCQLTLAPIEIDATVGRFLERRGLAEEATTGGVRLKR